VKWLRSVLSSLEGYGVDVSFPSAEAVQADQLTASVALVTLWVSGIVTAKTNGVVIAVHYDRNGSVVKQTNYRGTNSEVNWFSSEDEAQSMVDDSTAQIVKAMSGDLSSLCANPAGSPSQK
jgi:hypothetical protein